MSNLKALKACMKRNNLTSQEVADLLCKEHTTVYGWLSVGQTRPIPDNQLELLKRLSDK